MAEIGAMLREARMRAQLDVSELEARTKIRAKYLRALENEEWNLLPGPTFIKSFLRTYADALDLDSRLLVEEYKLRHERLSDVEMQPIGPPGPAAQRRPTPAVPRGAVIAVLAAALLVVLAILGSSGGSSNSGTTAKRKPSVPARAIATTPPGPRPATHRRVSLRLVPSGQVYVCLLASGGRKVVNGSILSPGSPTPTYHSRRFEITLGNSALALYVDGRALALPTSNTGLGYTITAAGSRPLALGHRPTCG